MKMNPTSRFSLLLTVLILVFSCLNAPAQEDVPLFTTDFTPQEFADRRAKIFDRIGENGIAILQGAASPAGYVRFRQTNEFYYLTGIEVPHAYVLLDGRQRSATLYLPHLNEPRERSEGKVLSAEDAETI